MLHLSKLGVLILVVISLTGCPTPPKPAPRVTPIVDPKPTAITSDYRQRLAQAMATALE